jgi:hypothetical protein
VVVQLVVTMEYLAQDSKSGRYRYRRRVPGELIKLIGKREFSISLKTTDQRLALERYDRVHREVESEIGAARVIDPADADHRATLQTLRKHDLVAPTLKSLAPATFKADPETFRKFTDAALRAPDHEFDRIVEAKFFGVQEPPLRLSKTASDRRAKDSRLPLTVEEIKRCNPFICKRRLRPTGIQLDGWKFQGSRSSIRFWGWPFAIASRVALR